MKNKLVEHGWFYFKVTDNGNLIGEFSNEHINGEICTESSVYVGGKRNLIGATSTASATYATTWLDFHNDPAYAVLKITRTGNVFALEWKENKAVLWKGNGMLCDGILVGEFHSPWAVKSRKEKGINS